MAGTKEELRELEKSYRKKMEEAPKNAKKFWERQLKSVRKQLYGHD